MRTEGTSSASTPWCTAGGRGHGVFARLTADKINMCAMTVVSCFLLNKTFRHECKEQFVRLVGRFPGRCGIVCVEVAFLCSNDVKNIVLVVNVSCQLHIEGREIVPRMVIEFEEHEN